MATFKSDKNREWDIIQTFPDLVNLLWSMENYRHGGKKERIEKPKKKKKSHASWDQSACLFLTSPLW